MYDTDFESESGAESAGTEHGDLESSALKNEISERSPTVVPADSPQEPTDHFEAWRRAKDREARMELKARAAGLAALAEERAAAAAAAVARQNKARDAWVRWLKDKTVRRRVASVKESARQAEAASAEHARQSEITEKSEAVFADWAREKRQARAAEKSLLAKNAKASKLAEAAREAKAKQAYEAWMARPAGPAVKRQCNPEWVDPPPPKPVAEDTRCTLGRHTYDEVLVGMCCCTGRRSKSCVQLKLRSLTRRVTR